MISTSQFRKGLKLKVDGELWVIVDFQNARTAQRRAKYTTRLKNIKTGAVVEKMFASGETFEQPDFEERRMQYMYTDGEHWHFMDSATYDQFILNRDQLGGVEDFLMENEEYKILFFEGEPLDVDMPTSVVLEIIEAEPAVKGDTVSNLTKGAKVATGLEIKVPAFIKVGDRVKIDTRTKEYLERV
jgi:elongation factor P